MPEMSIQYRIITGHIVHTSMKTSKKSVRLQKVAKKVGGYA